MACARVTARLQQVAHQSGLALKRQGCAAHWAFGPGPGSSAEVALLGSAAVLLRLAEAAPQLARVSGVQSATGLAWPALGRPA